MKKLFWRYFPFISVLFLIVCGVLFQYFSGNDTSYTNLNLIADSQNRLLIKKVEKLVFLPVGEIPIIATVSNPEVLKDQTFFDGAKKGDNVFIYTNAKKAILYDPVANKIINIATVSASELEESTNTLQKFQGNQLETDNPKTENQF